MSAIRQLFEAVCDLPAAEQEVILASSTAAAAVIHSVRALLAADSDDGVIALQRLAQCGDAIAPAGLTPGTRLGAWRLLREIGHGGMGRVYLAERADGHYRQQAAIKLIHERGDPGLAAHFQRERQLLAHLQHPQIARLVDGGETDTGQPYLVMDYVDGVPLDRWCAQRGLDLDARLALFVSVCAVVQYAHMHRVVHCDLKPSNILVRDDGVPMLLDFGIAHALDPFAHATLADAGAASAATDALSDSRRLTPRYASPEQLRGETPGLASDIYSLGLMLYELSTAEACPRRDPLPAPSRSQTAAHWNRRLSGDLDAIVARACAPNPERRYASVAALAEDVLRIGQHLPLAAHLPTWSYLGAKLLRRRWPVFATAVLLLAGAVGVGWRLVLAEHAAQREATTAQQAVDFLVSVFAVSDSNNNPKLAKDTTAREVLDNGVVRLRAELHDQPAVRARLLEALGHAYRHMGHGEAATKLLREAADLYPSTAVADLQGAARSLEALTNTMANGTFSAAATEQAAQQSLDLARRIHPADSQPIANALMVQSLALNRGGKHDAALAAAEASLTINLRQLPGNRVAPAWGNLALIKTSLGEFEAAYADNERAAVLSAPDAINQFYRNLTRGGLQERMGRYDEALASLRRAIAIEARFRDDSSALATWARSMIGHTLTSMGRYAEAQTELERAFADQDALGEDPGELLTIRTELARNRLYSGAGDAALAEFRRLHQARLDSYGADDPRTLFANASLAEALLASGDAGDATHAVLIQTRTSWQAKGQTGTPAELRVRYLLARCELERGEAKNAATLLSGVDAQRERLPFRERLDVTALQARVALRQGERERARALAQQALAAYAALLGDADPATQTMRRLTQSLAADTPAPDAV